jgi:hypothetical protein
MERAARLLSWLLLAWALVGLGASLHPAAELVAWALRWPVMGLLLVLGGWCFSHGVAGGVLRCLVAMAVLFAPWFHHVLTRVRLEEPRGQATLDVYVHHLDEVDPDAAVTLETMRSQHVDVFLLQGVTPQWMARLQRETVLRPFRHAHVPVGEGGVAVLARRLEDIQTVKDADGAVVGVCARVADKGPTLCSVQLAPPPVRAEPWETLQHWVVNAQHRERGMEALLAAVPNGEDAVWAGDFSTLEWEGLHARTQRRAVDAWRHVHPMDPGTTWPRITPDSPWAWWRRDMVWLAGAWAVSGMRMLPPVGSQHRALHVSLRR